jgi:hypothetical protein
MLFIWICALAFFAFLYFMILNLIRFTSIAIKDNDGCMFVGPEEQGYSTNDFAFVSVSGLICDLRLYIIDPYSEGMERPVDSSPSLLSICVNGRPYIDNFDISDLPSRNNIDMRELVKALPFINRSDVLSIEMKGENCNRSAAIFYVVE